MRNKVGTRNHWLGVNIIGKKSKRNGIGARFSYQSRDLKRSHMKVGAGSYLSSHDPRVVLGLGSRKKVDWLEVKWPLPSGIVEGYSIDRYITIVEGQGKGSEAAPTVILLRPLVPNRLDEVRFHAATFCHGLAQPP